MTKFLRMARNNQSDFVGDLDPDSNT